MLLKPLKLKKKNGGWKKVEKKSHLENGILVVWKLGNDGGSIIINGVLEQSRRKSPEAWKQRNIY